MAVESVMDEGVVGVDLIQDDIGVSGLTGSECDYFEVFAHAFEEGDGEGTDSHEALLVGLVERESDLYVIGAHPLLSTVEESLI